MVAAANTPGCEWFSPAPEYPRLESSEACRRFAAVTKGPYLEGVREPATPARYCY